MDFNFIIQRVIGILTKPNQEWEKIKGEQTDIVSLFMKYAIVLAAIPAIAGFFGWIAIGKSYMGYTVRMPFGRGILLLAFTYILSLAGVFLLGFVIDVLATNFGSTKNLDEAVKIAVYSSTASWVAGVLSIIPILAPLGLLAGLYSLYLLYLGIKIVKTPAKDKEVSYFIVTIIAYIVITIMVTMFVSLIVFGRMGGMY